MASLKASPTPTVSLPIDKGWKFKIRDQNIQNVIQEDANKFSEVKSFPSEVHAELVAGNVIPHPYKRDNEHRIQCESYELACRYPEASILCIAGVGDEEWLYAVQVPFQPTPGHNTAELVLEGLDTHCSVYWNSTLILDAENMLLPYTVSIAHPLTHVLPAEQGFSPVTTRSHLIGRA